MNVFCDYHHAGLFHSLELLFEKRLGWNLYRPIGMDWAKQGYWTYYPHPDTQLQYLGLHQGSLEPALRLNEKRRVEKGIYYIMEPSEQFEHRAVTFDKFLEMDWDIIIASVPQHLAAYSRLIKTFKLKAKLIFQMGNEFRPINFKLARNILSSTAPFSVPDGVNSVFYHQEFDLSIFRFVEKMPSNKIKTYLNWHQKMADYLLWQRFEETLRSFDFIEHGAGGADGVITGTKNIANSMRDALYVWHCKPGGDGFGHIIHNAIACGRPVVGRFSHYKDKLAGRLLEDGVTGIDLDLHSFEVNCQRLRYFSKPETYRWMCANARQRFDDEVDFDGEFEKIKVFLENLV